MNFDPSEPKLSPDDIRDSGIFPEDKKHEVTDIDELGIPLENKWDGDDIGDVNVPPFNENEIQGLLLEGQQHLQNDLSGSEPDEDRPQPDCESGENPDETEQVPPLSLDPPKNLQGDQLAVVESDEKFLERALFRTHNLKALEVEIIARVSGLDDSQDGGHSTSNEGLAEIWPDCPELEEFYKGFRIELTEELKDASYNKRQSVLFHEYLTKVFDSSHSTPTVLHMDLLRANDTLGLMVPTHIFRSIALDETYLTPKEGIPIFGQTRNESLLNGDIARSLQSVVQSKNFTVVEILRNTEREAMISTELVTSIALSFGLKGFITRCSKHMWRIVLSKGSTADPRDFKPLEDLKQELDGLREQLTYMTQLYEDVVTVSEARGERLVGRGDEIDRLRTQIEQLQKQDSENRKEIKRLTNQLKGVGTSKTQAEQSMSKNRQEQSQKGFETMVFTPSKSSGHQKPQSKAKKVITPEPLGPLSSSSADDSTPRYLSTNIWQSKGMPEKSFSKAVPQSSGPQCVAVVRPFEDNRNPLSIEFPCPPDATKATKKSKFFSHVRSRPETKRLARYYNFAGASFE